MAHLAENKAGVTGLQSAAGAGAAKMMDSSMEKMGMTAMGKAGPAMIEGMGPMRGMGEGMMHGMGPMMGMGEGMMHGMGPMMGMGESMGPMMGMSKGMMAGMGQAMNPGMTKGVAYGVAASAGAGAGKSVLRKVFTHPVTLIGLGFVVGYLVHKYRKSIVAASGEVSEVSSGKD